MTEDFTGWTESDALNRLSQTAARSTFADLNRTDDSIWLRYDYGAGYFTDFVLEFDIYLDACVQSAAQYNRFMYLTLANALEDWSDNNTASVTQIGVMLRALTPNYSLHVGEGFGGGSSFGSAVNIDLDTPYYLRLVKVGTSFTLYVYSDSSRTSLVGTSSLTLGADHSLRYIMAPQSQHLNGSYASDGYLENLWLGDAEDLFAKFLPRHPSSADLFAEFELPSMGSADLFSETEVLQPNIEDFTQYEETDPANRLTQSYSRSTFTNLRRGDAATRLIRDKGFRGISGTSSGFTHYFDYNITDVVADGSVSNRTLLNLFCYNNNGGDETAEPFCRAVIRENTNNNDQYTVRFRASYDGVPTPYDDSIVINTGWFWCKLIRSADGQTFTLYIYEDIGLTQIKDTLQVTDADLANCNFQWVHAPSTENYVDDPDDRISGWIQNLRDLPTFQELFADFTARHEASRNLKGLFDVGQNSKDLFADFTARHAATAELFADLEVRHEGSQNLFSEFASRQETSEDLFSDFTARQETSRDLKALFDVGQDSEDLFAKFITRHGATRNLFADFTVQHSDTGDLFASIDEINYADAQWSGVYLQAGDEGWAAWSGVYLQAGDEGWAQWGGIYVANDDLRASTSEDLFAKFLLRQETEDLKAVFRLPQEDLFAEFLLRQETHDLFAELVVAHWEDLKAVFRLNKEDLYASFTVIQLSQDLFTEATIRMEVAYNTFAKFELQESDSEDLFAEFLIGQETEDLFTEFTVRQETSRDLFAEITIAHWEDLFAKFRLYETDTADLFSDLLIRQIGTEDLFAEFELQESVALFADLMIRQEASTDFKALLCVHVDRYAQDLNQWTEYDAAAYLTHDCNQVDWANLTRAVTGTALTRTLPDGRGSNILDRLHANLYDVQETPDGQTERVILWAGHLANLSHDWYAQNDFEIVAVILHATGVADKYQLELREKGGNSSFMATTFDALQSRYLQVYKRGSYMRASVWQTDAYDQGTLIDWCEINLSGDLDFNYISAAMSYGQAGNEVSTGYINLIKFGSFQDLFSEFTIRQVGAAELFADFNIPIPASRDLFAQFTVRNTGIADLFSEFTSRRETYRDLFSELIVRHTSSADLYADLLPRYAGTADLFSELVARQESYSALFTDLIIRQVSFRDLFATFIPRYDGAGELFADFIARHESSRNLFAELTARQESIRDLFADVIIRQETSEDLFAELTARHEVTRDLKGVFDIGQDSEDLFAEFQIGYAATEDLFSEFILRQLTSEDLFAEIIIRQETAQNLFADFEITQWESLFSKFTVRQRVSLDLFSEFIARQSTSGDLFSEFIIRQEAYRDLFAQLIIQHTGIADLFADLIVRQPGTGNLFADFISRQEGTAQLFSEATLRQETSQDLFAEFEISGIGLESLFGEFTVRQETSRDLFADFIPRYESSRDLFADFITRQEITEELFGEIIIRNTGTTDLFSKLITRHSDLRNLLAELITRQETSRDLFTETTIRHTGITELFTIFIVRQEATRDLFAETILQQEASGDLFADFISRREIIGSLFADLIIRHSAARELFTKLLPRYETAEDLFADTMIRGAASGEIFCKLSVRQPISEDLFAKILIRGESFADLFVEFISRREIAGDLFAEFIAGHSTFLNLFAKATLRPFVYEDLPASFWLRQERADLPAEIIIRHSSFETLRADFWVRPPYRLWTNRRYINGVTELVEAQMDDAYLEGVIEGVMRDIKTALIADNITHYDRWTDITKTPRIIRRATTYGVVASLYARRAYIFKNVLPTVLPVNVLVMKEEAEQRASDHWEKRMEQMLEAYRAHAGGSSIWVDTMDEEPVFSMDDIAPPHLTENSEGM